jgi:deoxyribose-phosphate aldolase
MIDNQNQLDAVIRRSLERYMQDTQGTGSVSSIDDDLSVLATSEIASMIDHTLLKPDVVASQIRELCAQATRHGFASVCINASWIPLCVEELKESAVKICTVVGFPLGASGSGVKAFETSTAIGLGAREIDMVINIGRLKDRDDRYVYSEVRDVVEIAHREQAIVKVIIESCLLSNEEKVVACTIAQAAGANFVKTSTGFSSGGATAEDVALMRRTVDGSVGVKAAGGVRSLDQLYRVVAAGANRIGTSAGVQIMDDVMAAGERRLPRHNVEIGDSY